MIDNRCTKFLKVGIALISIMNVIVLITTLAISTSINDWTYLYGFLLCFASNYLIMFLSWYIPNKTIDFGLKNTSSKKVMVLVGFLFFFKYILFVLPLLTGQLINIYALNNEFLFNPWTMLATAFIYPIAVTLTKYWFIQKTKKQNVNKKIEGENEPRASSI